jgi:hypothetical protein
VFTIFVVVHLTMQERQPCPCTAAHVPRADALRDDAFKVHHSNTSSARASRAGGTVIPSAFAAIVLISSSNFVGVGWQMRFDLRELLVREPETVPIHCALHRARVNHETAKLAKPFI